MQIIFPHKSQTHSEMGAENKGLLVCGSPLIVWIRLASLFYWACTKSGRWQWIASKNPTINLMAGTPA
jgi:hypothetical protein